MQDFKGLRVWEAAHRLTLDVYQTTAGYPREETYGLRSQTRDAASSIPANIAEGCGRGGRKEFWRFLRIAAGSASELEYHILLGRDLHYIGESDYQRLNGQITEVKRMLASLINRVRSSSLPEYREGS